MAPSEPNIYRKRQFIEILGGGFTADRSCRVFHTLRGRCAGVKDAKATIQLELPTDPVACSTPSEINGC